MQAYPFQARHIAKLAEKVWEHSFLIDIKTIISELLCDEHNFFDTARYEFMGFTHQLFDRSGYVLSTHKRYGAEGAGTIAAFRNFD